MCCLLAVGWLLGPRALGFIWWLFDPVKWGTTFNVAIIGILGWLVLPWTTIAYVFVYSDGITGLDFGLLAIGIFADFASYGGSAYRRRDLGWKYQ